MRTLKATLIASTSLTALLLAGCATTSETHDHAPPSARYQDPRRVPKASAQAVAPQKRVMRAVSKSVGRPIPAVAKVSTVSEPPSVRIADPVSKPTIKAEPVPAPAAPVEPKPPFKAAEVSPNVVVPMPAKPASVEQPAIAMKPVSPNPLPPKAETPAATPLTKPAAERPKVAAGPVQSTAAPVALAKPEAAALPQAQPALPTTVAVKTPDVKTPESRVSEVVKVPEPPKAPDIATSPEVKPADARPLTQARQAAPQASALPQASAAPLPQAAAAPVVQAPVAPQVSATAPPAGPVRQAAIETAPAQAMPQAVPTTPQQRMTDGVARAADYMSAGRIANARSLLEDQAKSGDPAVLKALGETYDPMHLRDSYPKLARTGDPAKAMAAYEKAKAAGAKDLDARIDVLRAMITAKQ